MRALDAPAIVREIQGLSELVSLKYTIQKVVGLEEKKTPVGSEKLLLIVQAEALAGVDLQISPGASRFCMAGTSRSTSRPRKSFTS